MKKCCRLADCPAVSQRIEEVRLNGGVVVSTREAQRPRDLGLRYRVQSKLPKFPRKWRTEVVPQCASAKFSVMHS